MINDVNVWVFSIEGLTIKVYLKVNGPNDKVNDYYEFIKRIIIIWSNIRFIHCELLINW